MDASARRAADGSPRREPWVELHRFHLSPEGGTSVAFDVSPSGLDKAYYRTPRLTPWATVCRPPG